MAQFQKTPWRSVMRGESFSKTPDGPLEFKKLNPELFERSGQLYRFAVGWDGTVWTKSEIAKSELGGIYTPEQAGNVPTLIECNVCEEFHTTATTSQVQGKWICCPCMILMGAKLVGEGKPTWKYTQKFRFSFRDAFGQELPH